MYMDAAEPPKGQASFFKKKCAGEGPSNSQPDTQLHVSTCDSMRMRARWHLLRGAVTLNCGLLVNLTGHLAIR